MTHSSEMSFSRLGVGGGSGKAHTELFLITFGLLISDRK